MEKHGILSILHWLRKRHFKCYIGYGNVTGPVPIVGCQKKLSEEKIEKYFYEEKCLEMFLMKKGLAVIQFWNAYKLTEFVHKDETFFKDTIKFVLGENYVEIWDGDISFLIFICDSLNSLTVSLKYDLWLKFCEENPLCWPLDYSQLLVWARILKNYDWNKHVVIKKGVELNV